MVGGRETWVAAMSNDGNELWQVAPDLGATHSGGRDLKVDGADLVMTGYGLFGGSTSETWVARAGQADGEISSVGVASGGDSPERLAVLPSGEVVTTTRRDGGSAVLNVFDEDLSVSRTWSFEIGSYTWVELHDLAFVPPNQIVMVGEAALGPTATDRPGFILSTAADGL